jgi:PleD family two-component response regulator
VVAAIDDLFFVSKIRAVAETLLVPFQQVKSIEQAMITLADAQTSVVFADLQSEIIDSFALAERVRSEAHLEHVHLIGFYSHVNPEFQSLASLAGFDRSMPRSAFVRKLPELLTEGLGLDKNPL